jgi:Asp-tRNA(Asn)/Glu-tRNA(Gln) amidotransferase A subunit family amidase
LFLLRSKLIHKLLKLSFRELFYVKAYLMSRETNNSALEITQENLKNKVMAKLKAAGVEVVLTPGLFPAITKHTANATDFMCLYCFIWNYLNFPAGAVPMTRVKSSEQEYRSERPDKISQAIGNNMKGTEGLPIGVQIVSFPWREEMVMEVMKIVEAGADKDLLWDGK